MICYHALLVDVVSCVCYCEAVLMLLFFFGFLLQSSYFSQRLYFLLIDCNDLHIVLRVIIEHDVYSSA